MGLPGSLPCPKDVKRSKAWTPVAQVVGFWCYDDFCKDPPIWPLIGLSIAKHGPCRCSAAVEGTNPA